MQIKQRTGQKIGIGLFLVFCLATVSLLATLPARAVLVDQTIDDNRADYEQGAFLRTALFKQPNTEPESLKGVVQLVRLGALQPFNTANFSMPKPLVDAGSVAIGRRIYLIGGLTPDTQDNLEPVNEVWSGLISDGRDSNGIPLGIQLEGDWRAETALPKSEGYEPGNFYISRLYDMATAALDNETGNDYIYVLGGAALTDDNEGESGEDMSTVSVWIGTVDGSTGQITAWRTSDPADDVDAPNGITGGENMRIPSNLWNGEVGHPSNNEGTRRGLRAGAAIVHTIDGTSYLYLVGGRYRSPGVSSVSGTTEKVVYARIGSDGLLYRPSTTGDTADNLGWEQLTDIPATVADGALMKSTSIEENTALYLLAGQTQLDPSPEYTNEVYVADINSDGTITWDAQKQATTNVPVTFHTAEEANGSIYIIGGREQINPGELAQNPTQDAGAGVIEEDLSLFNFNEGTPLAPQYFEEPNEQDLPPLPGSRAQHTSVVVQFAGQSFVYVLGGLTDEGQAAPTSIFYFRVSTSTPEETPFAPGGWYTSRIFEIGLGEAQIQEISWDPFFPSSPPGAMDIQIEYRTTNTAQCTTEALAEASWIPIRDGNATSGRYSNEKTSTPQTNSYDLTEGGTVEPAQVRCFQYRAFLEPNSFRDLSPLLERVGLRIYSPNSPDIRVLQILPVWQKDSNNEDLDGFLEDLDIRIINQYESAPENTLNADIEGGPAYFYVDGYVFGPGQATPPSQTNEQLAQDMTTSLPVDDDGYGGVSPNVQPIFTADDDLTIGAGVQKSSMPAGATRQLQNWCVSNLDNCSISGQLKDLFTQSGEYTVCVAADAYVNQTDWPTWGTQRTTPASTIERGYVSESLSGAEDNNVLCTTFNVIVAPLVTMTIPDITDNLLPEGQSTTFTLSVNEASAQAVTIPFTVDGDATFGSDYRILDSGGQPLSAQNLVIPANETSVTFTFEAIDDGSGEPDAKYETALLTLTESPGGLEYLLNQPSGFDVTIVDEAGTVPPPPTVVLGYVQTDTTSGDIEFYVERDPSSSSFLTVNFTITGRDGATLTRGTDYQLLYSGGSQVGTSFVLAPDASRVNFVIRPLPAGLGKAGTIALSALADRYTLGTPSAYDFVLDPNAPPPTPTPTPETGPPAIYLPLIGKP